MLWKCVEFAQDAITGLALLELAGVSSGQPPQVYDWGGGAYTVCQIDHEPVSVPDRCFGPTSGPNWSDWSIVSGGWHPRSTGAGGYSVRDGEIEGWTYTAGFGAPPPTVQFSQVCAAPGASSEQTPGPETTTVTLRASPLTVGASPTSAPPPMPTLQALAPSVSPTPKAALAVTGPSAHGPPPPSSAATWLLLLVGTAVLVGLAAINLPRRGP